MTVVADETTCLRNLLRVSYAVVFSLASTVWVKLCYCYILVGVWIITFLLVVVVVVVVVVQVFRTHKIQNYHVRGSIRTCLSTLPA